MVDEHFRPLELRSGLPATQDPNFGDPQVDELLCELPAELHYKFGTLQPNFCPDSGFVSDIGRYWASVSENPLATESREQDFGVLFLLAIRLFSRHVRKVAPLPLKSFQIAGCAELIRNPRYVLADTMGLGKTEQVCAALKFWLWLGIPQSVLVLAPKSLLPRWMEALSVWKIPSLLGKESLERRLPSGGVRIYNYEHAIRIQQDLRRMKFDLVVCDESQRLRNSNTTLWKTIEKLDSVGLWLVTGTPIENYSKDLTSLLALLFPQTIDVFNPALYLLRELSRTYILRRTVDGANISWPEVTISDVWLGPSVDQAAAYQEELTKAQERRSNVFPTLLKLRQICNHFGKEPAGVKLNYLVDFLKVCTAEKILLFSTFLKSLEIIAAHLTKNLPEWNILTINGEQSPLERQSNLSKYRKCATPSLLLLTYGAGGVGLNIPEASKVILYDRVWNPALERQAIARATRMSSKNASVDVFRLGCKDTIEERIELVQSEKVELINSLDDLINFAKPETPVS